MIERRDPNRRGNGVGTNRQRESFLAKVRKTDRRTFITRAALIGGGSVALGLPILSGISSFSQSEMNILKDGIPKDYGNFFPLYGNIPPEEIPSDLDIIFRDKEMAEADFNSALQNPVDFLRKSLFPEGVLEKLAKNQTRIVFGNLGIEYFSLANHLMPLAEAGVVAIAAFNRRNLFKSLVSGGIFASLGNTLAPVVASNSDRFGRTLQRAGGRTSAFHPENRGIYLSDAKMAHAMILSAFIFGREHQGKRPKVGINISPEHSNVEEFLKQGFGSAISAITDSKTIITGAWIYSPEFIQELVRKSGGVSNFCSAVEIFLPADFSEKEALNDPVKNKDVVSRTQVRMYPPDEVLASQLKAIGVE